ncbi:hypothetical protein BAY47_04105 [Klebsiella pneumoniae]|nr:hypothetical protein A6D83_03825 [Klebsiella pneumoniae]ODO86038.1 hypothetical protein BAY47_04105 [Klebsiella pneumoniae]
MFCVTYIAGSVQEQLNNLFHGERIIIEEQKHTVKIFHMTVRQEIIYLLSGKRLVITLEIFKV